MQPTIEQLREAERVRQNELEEEKARLKEKVLCAEVTFPSQMQKALGITGFTMKASELSDFVEQEIENGDFKSVTYSVRFMMMTNKWIESLPEANI